MGSEGPPGIGLGQRPAPDPALLSLPGLRFLRDPTRGGLATVAHELARATASDVRLRQGDIPVGDPVQFMCEMLGYDPMYLACEGRVVAVVSPQDVDEALRRWTALPDGRQAALVDETAPGPGHVVLETDLGGERLLEELEDDPLRRIC